MTLPLSFVAIAGGLLLLGTGAHFLVYGSSRLALRLGMTPLAVGLTVVAFGTSSPELIVSLEAAVNDNGAIALGNVIGSNIANFALILGTAALISPVSAEPKLIRLDIPIVVGCSLLLSLLLADDVLTRWDGLLLTIGILCYTTFTFWEARREEADTPASYKEEMPETDGSLWTDVLMILGGLALLVGGASALVEGATNVAEHVGVSQAVIGLTIVAFGTSLPELATAVVAANRGEGELVVGNVVGSNIFNLLGILGPAALLRPLPGDEIGTTTLVAMIGLAILLLPLMRTRFRISRWEGGILLVIYGAYVYHLLPT